VTNTDWQGYSGESTMSYLRKCRADVQNYFPPTVLPWRCAIRGFIRHRLIASAILVDVRAHLVPALALSIVLASSSPVKV